jgi:hypothetical protein
VCQGVGRQPDRHTIQRVANHALQFGIALRAGIGEHSRLRLSSWERLAGAGQLIHMYSNGTSSALHSAPVNHHQYPLGVTREFKARRDECLEHDRRSRSQLTITLPGQVKLAHSLAKLLA